MIDGIVFDPPPFLFLIIGVIVGMALGWAIGYVDSNNRTSKKIEAAETRAEQAVSEAEQKIAAAQAQSRPATQAGVDGPGLLRLKHVNGTPSLEMDGALLNIKMVTSDQKKRLIELLTYIRPWVEGGQSLQPVAKPAAPAQPVSSSFAPTPTQPLPPVKPAEEKNIRSLSIVAQIDTVLQAQLVDTPLANKGIRLTESSIGGVEVYVGLNKYASIDDVPDKVIQDVIRTAIAEWEQKFTPGL